MDLTKHLLIIGILGFFGTANALPIFSHSVDSLGLYTVNADGAAEPIGLAGLNVDNISGTALGSDYGINYADYFSIIDANYDNLLSFTFTNSSNLTALTGSAFYNDESFEAFEYTLVAEAVNPPLPEVPITPDVPSTPDLTPTPNVPEPSTFLLLGVGLLVLGVTRFGRIKS
ncbi:MAG: PEP-CTERM sorting domain-containing protein [Candidatus Thiodiazotropha sp.]